jgi:adenylate cyclase
VKPFGVFALLVRGVTWVAAAGLLTLLLAGGMTTRWDDALYDFHMRHWHYIPSDDVVIIAIDQKSLDALGSWPWPRSTHARLIDRLTDLGVSTIGMNVTMSESDTGHSGSDRSLAQAIRHHGRVVMPVYADASELGGPLQEMLPVPEIASVTADFGHVDVPQDADGVTRGAYLHAGLDRPRWPLLGLAMYEIDHPGSHVSRQAASNLEGSPYVWARDDYVLIRYSGPPGTFGNVSYVDVLNGDIDPGLLKGKTVLVGTTVKGMGEGIFTPEGRHDTPMSGLEYQANVLESLRHGRLIAPLDLSRGSLLGAVALGLPLLIYGWGGLRRAWLVAVVSVAATLLASLIMLRFFGVWWPPMSVILIVIVGLIVWSVLAPRLKHERTRESDGSAGRIANF